MRLAAVKISEAQFQQLNGALPWLIQIKMAADDGLYSS
jgi:hypothetical protein